jgi:hypothetical protein
MRATKLVFAFLLSLALAIPPGLVAQSRGKGPDKNRGQGQGKAKVEKPEKPQQTKRQNRGRSAERPPQRARPAPKAQKPQRAERDRRSAPVRQRVRDSRDDTRRARENADRVVRDVRDGNLRFRGMDTNGDRRISRSEWRGNDVSFGNHDWNGDGILSGSEVIPGGRPGRLARDDDRTRIRIRDQDRRGDIRIYRDSFGHRIALAPAPLVTRIDRYYSVTRRFDVEPARYRSPEPDLVRLDFGLDLDPIHRFHRIDAPSDSLLDRLALPLALLVTDALLDDVGSFVAVERFSSYDRDFDGYVAPNEWPAGGLAFDRYDLDDDGYLVSSELYADDDLIVIDRDRLLLFQGMDRDDDGLVAPWEWPGDLDSFWFRDHNGDGAVSLDEYLGLDVDMPVRDLEFDAIDYDRSGEIARVEWVGDPYRFQRLDRNDNGVVGRWEYAFGWLRGV